MDSKDQEFVDELQKRLSKILGPASSGKHAKDLVIKAVDSMIKDKIIGPAFHVEVETKVKINKRTGVMDISFRERHIPVEEGDTNT